MDPNEFGFENAPDLDIDELLDDEDELDVLREIENHPQPPPPSVTDPKTQSARRGETEDNLEDVFKEFENEAFEAQPTPVVVKSPHAKRPRLTEDFPVLEDVSNKLEIMEEDPTTPSPSEILASLRSQNCYKLPRVGDRKVYRRIPVDADYQSITMTGGERYYLRMKAESSQALKDDDIRLRNDERRRLGLCGQPYGDLLDQAIQEKSRLQEQMETITATEAEPMEIGKLYKHKTRLLSGSVNKTVPFITFRFGLFVCLRR